VLDADGYLSVVDRKKDMIKSGGERRAVQRGRRSTPMIRRLADADGSHRRGG